SFSCSLSQRGASSLCPAGSFSGYAVTAVPATRPDRIGPARHTQRSGPRTGTASLRSSAAQAQTLDQRPVALDVGLLEVAEQALALADQQQQAASAVVVVLVLTGVLGELLDPGGQERDLDLRRAGVALGRGVLLDDLLLGGSVHRHGRLLLSLRGASRACPPGHSGSAAVLRRRSGYQRPGGHP